MRVLWIVAALMLVGCGDAGLPASIEPDHSYVMQDGMKYGYPQAISENAKKAGQQGESLVMALYAGSRDGKYQAHVIDGNTVTAMECAPPCAYLKIMTYVDIPYGRDRVVAQTIATTPQTLGYVIMKDAINGKLKQYGREFEGRRYQMWVDENKGMQRFPLN